MKKIGSKLFVLGVLFFVTGQCLSQKVRITGYGSYVMDGSYHIYYNNGQAYKGVTSEGLQVGLGAEYLLTPSYSVELNYLKRNTTVSPDAMVSQGGKTEPLQLRYILLGLNSYTHSVSGVLQAFAGVSAGVVLQCATITNDLAGPVVNHSITKFAWAARLGGLLWLSRRVGLKLQGQWLSALQFQDAAVNFNVHGLNGMPAESSIANQFELGSGLVVKLGSLK